MTTFRVGKMGGDVNNALEVAIISNVVAASLLVLVVAFDGPLLQMTVALVVMAGAITGIAARRLKAPNLLAAEDPGQAGL